MPNSSISKTDNVQAAVCMESHLMTPEITKITEFLTSIWNEKAVSCKCAVTEKGKSLTELEQKINSEAESNKTVLSHHHYWVTSAL